MKDAKYESVFPKDFFLNSPSNKHLSPINLKTISKPKNFQMPSLKIKKTIKASEILIDANFEKERHSNNLESKFSLNSYTPHYYSGKNLPQLKPTIHISSFTPRKLPPLQYSPNLLTFTFSSKQTNKETLFK